MAQNNINYGNNPTGPELLDDYLAKEQENILTSNSGIQRPSYADVGTKWLDISSTPWKLMMFDGTSDVIIGTVNQVMHAFTPAGIDTAVLLTGNQTIGGTKTFTVSPQVPTASSGDSSSNVANTAFVTSADSNLQTQINQKANSSDVVHKSSDETIAGAKTFSTSPIVPTVASSDNSTKAASTAFIKNVLGSSGNGLATISKAAKGYCKFNNGFIVQWGTASGSGTIQFPIEFTSTNAVVIFQRSGADGTNDNDAVYNITKKTFDLRNYGGSQGGRWLAVGY